MISGEQIIHIDGIPVPKGSLRCVGRRGRRAHVLIEDNPQTKPWREKIAREAARSIVEHADKGQALGVQIVSTLPRPASQYGTGKNSGVLRARAVAHPTALRTGDVDKLARLVLDALQDSAVIVDDAQVVEVVSRKRWPDESDEWHEADPTPGVTITIYPIDTYGER